MTRQQRIRRLVKLSVEDIVADLLYYDRQEDEELKLGEIEEAIRLGTFTVDNILSWFRSAITEHLSEATSV